MPESLFISNSTSGPETQCLEHVPSGWLIFYWSYLRTYALGKGLMELVQPWTVLIYSQQPVDKYIIPVLTSEGGYSSTCFPCLLLEAFSILFTLIKLLHKALSDWDSVFWVLEWNFLLQRPWTLALFSISYPYHHKEGKNIQWRKDSFFSNGTAKTVQLHVK